MHTLSLPLRACHFEVSPPPDLPRPSGLRP